MVRAAPPSLLIEATAWAAVPSPIAPPEIVLGVKPMLPPEGQVRAAKADGRRAVAADAAADGQVACVGLGDGELVAQRHGAEITLAAKSDRFTAERPETAPAAMLSPRADALVTPAGE